MFMKHATETTLNSAETIFRAMDIPQGGESGTGDGWERHVLPYSVGVRRTLGATWVDCTVFQDGDVSVSVYLRTPTKTSHHVWMPGDLSHEGHLWDSTDVDLEAVPPEALALLLRVVQALVDVHPSARLAHGWLNQTGERVGPKEYLEGAGA